MKKLLTLAVLVGGVTAAVVYKMKKQQEEKEMLDMEIDLLNQEIEEAHEECLRQAAENEETCECECTCECDEACDCEGTCECQETCKCDESCECECDEECECTCSCGCTAEEENIHEEVASDIKEETDPEYPNLNGEVKAAIETMNQEMMDSLQSQGDNHDEERPIQHFIEFTNEEDLHAFKQVIVNKGYVVTRGENPLALSVLHIAPVDRSKLVMHIYYIANQAINHHGTYKGWKSRVAY